MDMAMDQNPAANSNHGKPLFVGIYQEAFIPWLLRWCEMDFVHPLDYWGEHMAMDQNPNRLSPL